MFLSHFSTITFIFLFFELLTHVFLNEYNGISTIDKYGMYHIYLSVVVEKKMTSACKRWT